MADHMLLGRKKLPHCRTCVCDEEVKVLSQVTIASPKRRKESPCCKRRCTYGWGCKRCCSGDEWDSMGLGHAALPPVQVERKIRTEDKFGSLEHWFKRFDFDCNGHLDLFELRAMLNFMGAQMQPDYIRRMMEKADKDGDGCLSFPEFLLMWRQAASHDEELYEIMKEHDLYPDVLQVEDFRGRYPKKVTDIVKRKCGRRCACEGAITRKFRTSPRHESVEIETKYSHPPASQRKKLPVLSSYR